MLYASSWSRFEFTKSGVIGTDCIGSCKSNYHTITTTTAPNYFLYFTGYRVLFVWTNFLKYSSRHFLKYFPRKIKRYQGVIRSRNSKVRQYNGKKGINVGALNATFNNILVISWLSNLLMEEIKVPWESQWPTTNHYSSLYDEQFMSVCYVSRRITSSISYVTVDYYFSGRITSSISSLVCHGWILYF